MERCKRPEKDETVKAGLKNIVAEHSNLALDEIDTAIAAEKSQNSVAFGSMQVLSWLVFLFGVINLINTTLSNQMSRKQETVFAFHWSDPKTAMQNEYLRGPMLCFLCNIGNPDCRTSYFCRCKQRNG